MKETKENTSSGEATAEPSRCERLLPKRYVLAIMCHLAFFFRGLVMANIAMIIFNYVSSKKDKEKEVEDHLPSIANFTTVEMANIVYSYYWVNAFGQIPSAMLAFTFSPHKIMVTSIILSFVLQMITPWTLTKSITGVVIIVLLQALCLCPLDCACIGLWKKWAPSTEKTRLLMISFSGRYAHFQIAFWFCTYLSEAISTSSIYYFAGITGSIWCILWCSLLKDSPETIPDQQCLEDMAISEENINLKSVPIKSILMSIPVLCLCGIFISPGLSYRLLLDSLYIHTVDGMENLSVWTLIVNSICILPAVGFLIDRLINGKKLKTTTIRKVVCSGGLILHVLFMILYLVPHELTSELCFIVAFLLMDLTAAGIVPNILDLSSRYCVIIMGLAMTGVSVSGVLADYIQPLIFSEGSEWNTSQIPLVLFSLIAALLYVIFGSAEEQTWSSATLPIHGNQEGTNTRISNEEETEVTKNL